MLALHWAPLFQLILAFTGVAALRNRQCIFVFEAIFSRIPPHLRALLGVSRRYAPAEETASFPEAQHTDMFEQLSPACAL